jgi:ketosteroid isomerase-like protein
VPSSDQEIVRRAFEAFTNGDLDGALEFCDPHIRVHDPGRTGRTFEGRPELSGIEIGADLFQVFRLREGKVIEYRIYADRDEALESVRLTE